MSGILGHVAWKLRTMQFHLQPEILKLVWSPNVDLIFFFTKISINEISKQWSDCCQGFYWSAHKCARCLKTVSRQSLKIFHRSSLHLEHGRTGSEGGRKRSFDFDGDSCNMEIMRTWVFRTASLCGSDWL